MIHEANPTVMALWETSKLGTLEKVHSQTDSNSCVPCKEKCISDEEWE